MVRSGATGTSSQVGQEIDLTAVYKVDRDQGPIPTLRHCPYYAQIEMCADDAKLTNCLLQPDHRSGYTFALPVLGERSCWCLWRYRNP